MGDAYKCKDCGTVVETLQSCPSCGESAMRPIQSSAEGDVMSDITESGTVEGDTTEASSTARASEAEESTRAATESDGSPEPAPSDPSDSTEPDTTAGRNRERGKSASRSESGLLSWLKSLF